MALFEELKSVAKVLQEAGKIDLYEKLLSIQQELLDMQEKLRLKDETIRELKEKVKLKGEVLFEKNSCWRKLSDDTMDGPYCSGCWDDKRKLIHLNKTIGTGLWRCPACGATTTVRN